jgi:hypothetical protein
MSTRTYNPISLRAAIANTPSSRAYFEDERKRLYAAFDIPTNEDGEPVDEKGRPVLRENPQAVPKSSDLPYDANELPAGMATAALIAEKYNCDTQTIKRYLAIWRIHYDVPVAGYYRKTSPSSHWTDCTTVTAYYDLATFGAFLVDIADRENGARRLLHGLRTGSYPRRGEVVA